jgi:hypothetical protein
MTAATATKPATNITITLPRPHAGQVQILRDMRRFNVLACGRRFGKTWTLEIVLIEPALKGYPVAWFAPSYKLMLEVWREVKQRLAPVTSRVNSQEYRIELITGGVVEFWSLDNADAGRGRKYKRVVIDEASFVRALLDAWQQAIRPTLTDYQGDAFFAGTPKGHNGFWQTYQWGLDPSREEWRCWQMPTSANPFINPAEIEAARRDLPERVFAQEYLAVFLDDAGGVFRNVMAAAHAEARDKAQPDHQYAIGVDWARSNDFTVIAVIDTTARALVALDRFNQIDYTLQRVRLHALWERFGMPPVVAESNSMGMPVIEELRKEGMNVQPFNTTNASKTDIIDGLALAFERGDIAILNDPVLIGELQAYEAERLPSGLLRYSAPEGMHDDTVMALALAWYGATNARRPLFAVI